MCRTEHHSFEPGLYPILFVSNIDLARTVSDRSLSLSISPTETGIFFGGGNSNNNKSVKEI